MHFLVRSLHAAKTLVQLIANTFRTRPVDQQPIARFCFLSELHEAEIAARAATPSLPAAGPEAGVLTTLSPFSLFPPLPSSQTTVFGASSSSLRFAPLQSPASQTSGVTSLVLASISAAKLFANSAFLLTATPIQKPVVSQSQKSAESSKASKFSPEFAKYMIRLINDRTANSTVIAELGEAIRSCTVTSDARLPTETATSPAASGTLSSVAIVT